MAGQSQRAISPLDLSNPETILLPAAFRPLFQPSRYKAFFGGRGSAKSHSFATVLLKLGASRPLRVLCCREVQNSIADSVKQLLDDKIMTSGLEGFYTSAKSEITGPNGTRFMFAGLKAETVQSLKSKEGIDIAWVEEAHTVSQKSIDILEPTIRAAGSEIWFSWNPDNEFDAVDRMFRGPHVPPDSIVRNVSWRDNPWFPDALRKLMNFHRDTDPGKAAHIWDGDYQQAPKGAYYADLIAKALSDGRIGRVPHDPSTDVYVSFDLGVGQTQALWFTQRVGAEIRVIDYLEGDEDAANEGYGWYARKMRERGYNYAELAFPHDGRTREATGKSRAGTMEEHHFSVSVLDRLPPEDGIDAVKRLLPMCRFDADKCNVGLTALKNYRENWDDALRRSNGPLKDWTNHAADSFRYTAMAYDAPMLRRATSSRGAHTGSWMS